MKENNKQYKLLGFFWDMLKDFKINTKSKQELIDITDKIKEIVENSGIEKGICVVYVPHATAGILINENCDKYVCEDIINRLEELIPESGKYEHDKIDNNAHSHIKASLIGPSETIIIKDSELMLGKWQGIGFMELDGPRERRVIVKIIEG